MKTRLISFVCCVSLLSCGPKKDAPEERDAAIVDSSAPIDAGVDDGGGDALDCVGVLTCLDPCEDEACSDACLARATSDGRSRVIALAVCVDREGCTTDACIEERCATEVASCVGDEPTPSSGPFLVRRDVNSGSPTLVQDAAGVTHLLAAPGTRDTPGGAFVTYGRCASSCERQSSWGFVSLIEGATSTESTLDVAPSGEVHTAFLVDGVATFGRCASDCLRPASWTFQAVTAPEGQTWTRLPNGRPFSVSSVGDRRLFVSGSTADTIGYRTMLVASRGAEWRSDVLFVGEAVGATIARRGTGHGALVVNTASSGYTYLECADACELTSSWSGTSGVLPGASPVAGLVVDERGALHASTVSGGQLHYATCANECTASARWSSVALGRESDALGGVALATRSDGALGLVSMSVVNEVQSVFFRSCASGCTSASAWSAARSFGGADVSDALPEGRSIACEDTTRVWALGGGGVSAVPSGSSWVLAYDAVEVALCVGDVSSRWRTGQRFVRVHGL